MLRPFHWPFIVVCTLTMILLCWLPPPLYGWVGWPELQQLMLGFTPTHYVRFMSATMVLFGLLFFAGAFAALLIWGEHFCRGPNIARHLLYGLGGGLVFGSLLWCELYYFEPSPGTGWWKLYYSHTIGLIGGYLYGLSSGLYAEYQYARADATTNAP